MSFGIIETGLRLHQKDPISILHVAVIATESNQIISILVVLSEFAELNKVQRPNLWPYDYSFMRMSRYVTAKNATKLSNKMGVV